MQNVMFYLECPFLKLLLSCFFFFCWLKQTSVVVHSVTNVITTPVNSAPSAAVAAVATAIVATAVAAFAAVAPA